MLWAGGLQQNVENDVTEFTAASSAASSLTSEPRLSTAVQFVLFSLWTRFGLRGTSQLQQAEDEAATAAAAAGYQATRPKAMGKTQMVQVKRHQLVEHAMITLEATRSTTRSQIFVSFDKSFHIDPLGVTNLDLLNRALDIAGKTLLAVLKAGAARAAKERLLSPQGTSNCRILLWAIEQHVEYNADTLTGAPRRGQLYKKDTRESKVRLLERYDPRHDPRHIAEFLVRLKDCKGESLSPLLAREMCVIRDKVEHRINLSKSGTSMTQVVTLYMHMLRILMRIMPCEDYAHEHEHEP